MRAPSRVIQWSWMEYGAGLEISVSSTDFTITFLLPMIFTGNSSTKIKHYVIDIASVALIRGASAPRFLQMPISVQGELIVIGRKFCSVQTGKFRNAFLKMRGSNL